MATTNQRRGFFKFLVDCTYSLVSFIVLVMLMWAFLFSFVLRTVEVDGTSMQDTLQDGQRMVLISAAYTPKRGDIVVANRLDNEKTSRFGVSTYEEPIIKRVIGLPGDVVQVEKDKVYVNGAELKEPYVHYENSHAGCTYYVPAGTVFLMGDHRNGSTDSRATGPIKMENIVGHVVARLGGGTKIETISSAVYNGIPSSPSAALVEEAKAEDLERAKEKEQRQESIRQRVEEGTQREG